ncbi:probable 2,3-bisphosphoglycerate-independent phosphoglycerate mutase, partial [Tanacetum coccineum]
LLLPAASYDSNVWPHNLGNVRGGVVLDFFPDGCSLVPVIDDAGHDKATVFKVKGLEAVDKVIGQLAKLLWEAASTDYMGAVGARSMVLQTSLHTFPLPVIKAGEDLSVNMVAKDNGKSKKIQAFVGDSVWELNELVAGKGCLGWFPGSEMMGIIKIFIALEL